MNRQERRAANKRRNGSVLQSDALAVGLAGSGLAELAVEASRLHRAGRIVDAQNVGRHILTRDPSHVQTLNLLGLIAQNSGDHLAAAKMFAKAIASDDLNAAVHYNAGRSYQALGRRAKASGHFTKALELGM